MKHRYWWHDGNEVITLTNLNIFSYWWAAIIKLDSSTPLGKEFIGHFLSGAGNMCVCVCISVHRKGFSWLNRTLDVLPDIQTSEFVLRKLFRDKNLRLHVIDDHSRDLLASNCARVSIKSGRAARSKRQLLKLSETNSKSANHSYLPPHLPREPSCRSTRPTVTKKTATYRWTVTTPRGGP